ncbi:hypothetical protein OESDEN_17965 [Oesophagostomum dentatum]|uniref:SCP domain-containing protein n=1 Tax=Oesophagostomum dentatum TaxID=61180 RepID=A0A0B1SEL8_OESDE|nr:hypothetical protein OESDEN_17965 [Oesophagostomum dentatum]
MLSWCAVLALLSAVSLSEAIVQEPDCSQLRGYALDRERRLQLYVNAEVAKGPSLVNGHRVYECALEAYAALLLRAPEERAVGVKELGIYPLLFRSSRDSIPEVFEAWEPAIKKLKASQVGCSYAKNSDGSHLYLCLFKLEQ